MLKPQDLLVTLHLAALPEAPVPTFQALSMDLGMSASEVHASVKRAVESGLVVDTNSRQVNRKNLLEFLLHGVRYAFPAAREGITRGVPTSYAAPPLNQQFSLGDSPPVWPHPEGQLRGEGLSPLYRSVPDVVVKQPALYELLALVDAVRAGRARERELASRELARRLSK